MNKIQTRFLVVDDHTIIRSALTFLLQDAYPNALIEESPDGSDVIERVKKSHFDLIIMDIQMPKNEAMGLIRQVHLAYPFIPILVYSMTPEKIYAIPSLKAGAKGFLSKGSTMDELKEAIRTVLEGKSYLSPDIVQILSEQTLTKSAISASILTVRELQIVELLLAGYRITMISKMLGLKNTTVGTHKSHIFKKLKVVNLMELKSISESIFPASVA